MRDCENFMSDNPISDVISFTPNETTANFVGEYIYNLNRLPNEKYESAINEDARKKYMETVSFLKNRGWVDFAGKLTREGLEHKSLIQYLFYPESILRSYFDVKQ